MNSKEKVSYLEISVILIIIRVIKRLKRIWSVKVNNLDSFCIIDKVYFYKGVCLFR